MDIYERISQQQKGKEGTAVWMVGEQLKDMCRTDPACIPLLEQDLQIPEMSLAKAERKIEAYARQHKKGNQGCCPPNEAERILREFYGLPAPTAKDKPTSKVVSLWDALGGEQP